MVSPYLNRPVRSLDEVLQARGQADRAAPERRGGIQPGELAPRHEAPAPQALPEGIFVETSARREAA